MHRPGFPGRTAFAIHDVEDFVDHALQPLVVQCSTTSEESGSDTLLDVLGLPREPTGSAARRPAWSSHLLAGHGGGGCSRVRRAGALSSFSFSTNVVIVFEIVFDLGAFELLSNLGLCILSYVVLICSCTLIGRFLLRVSGVLPVCCARGISGGCDALWRVRIPESGKKAFASVSLPLVQNVVKRRLAGFLLRLQRNTCSPERASCLLAYLHAPGRVQGMQAYVRGQHVINWWFTVVLQHSALTL